MAAFATTDAAEARCKTQMLAGIWLVAHVERTSAGVIASRFIRPMSAASPTNGGWVETTDDTVN